MSPRFDLIDIVQTLQRRIRFILIIAVGAALLGAVLYLVRSKQYKATATFFISNPKYVDRTNLFRGERSQFIDYFGTEDDVDKVVAIANSDSLARKVILAQQLGQVYQLDPAKPEDMARLINTFHSNYEAKRTENTTMDISYTDHDAKRAADVANATTEAISSIYSSYFTGIHSHIAASLQHKIRETDSTIALLTDTLAAMRERYGIYDIISPARKNIITGNMHSSGAGFGRALEEIQTVESNKDQLVMSRAEYLSVLNEFNDAGSEMPLIQVLNKAHQPFKTKDFGLVGTVAIAFLVALFFSALWVLFAAYFRAALSAPRTAA